MFSKQRYLTREVADKVPVEIQLLMWNMIEELNVKKDYLQVFKLKEQGQQMLEIIHKQEIPEFMQTILIKNIGVKKEMKIYVIDSGDYSTMMFSHEY
ncbi:MAG: DUF960 domain-containing protein [Paeniclostridium sp.]|nr:DUF960 family protein [Paeniclostridium sp.]MBW4862706.1 DUF960 domain-containing protein [Paeniclostridium sp.]MBW4874007.1 DUF960 domain-containing protein [Paeniclostridium sp.]